MSSLSSAGWAKKWHKIFIRQQLHQILTYVQNFFSDGISRKCVVTIALKIPPHLYGAITLPCEMSDIALKPVTTMTNRVINVAQA